MPVRMARFPLPASLPQSLFAFLLASLLAVPAAAAERNYSVSSFERIRIDGPFRVILTTGRPPSAKAEGAPQVTDALDIRVEGGTLIVRAGANGWGEQPVARDRAAPVIRVSTGMIRGAALIGGGDLRIVGPLRGQRIDLALTGSGSLSTDGREADQLFASAIGAGSMTLGGRAARARLATSGPVRLQAGDLVANDLTVRADGNGDLVAQARYTASVSSTGIGSVTVYGKAACTMLGVANGPVSCGKLMPPGLPTP